MTGSGAARLRKAGQSLYMILNDMAVYSYQYTIIYVYTPTVYMLCTCIYIVIYIYADDDLLTEVQPHHPAPNTPSSPHGQADAPRRLGCGHASHPECGPHIHSMGQVIIIVSNHSK